MYFGAKIRFFIRWNLVLDFLGRGEIERPVRQMLANADIIARSDRQAQGLQLIHVESQTALKDVINFLLACSLCPYSVCLRGVALLHSWSKASLFFLLQFYRYWVEKCYALKQFSGHRIALRLVQWLPGASEENEPQEVLSFCIVFTLLVYVSPTKQCNHC
jgi:hypothetical protein